MPGEIKLIKTAVSRHLPPQPRQFKLFIFHSKSETEAPAQPAACLTSTLQAKKTEISSPFAPIFRYYQCD